MTTHRVRRGRESEEAVARFLRDYGWPGAERRPASLPGSDVIGLPGVDIEVKARREFRPVEWARQQAARKHAGELPLCIIRPDGMGLKTVADWPAFLRLGDVALLLREGGWQ